MTDYGRSQRTPAHSLEESTDVPERTAQRPEQIDERRPYRPQGYADVVGARQESMNVPRAAPGEGRHHPRDWGFRASAPSAVALLGGLWLVVSRFVYSFPGAGSRPGGVSNGIFIGIAVALIALVRLSNADSNPALSAVNVVLGGWMIASPWVFGYTSWGSAPTWSDIITGAVIGAAALASLLAGATRAIRRPRDVR